MLDILIKRGVIALLLTLPLLIPNSYATTNGSGEGYIAGNVTSKSDNAPLAGATIVVNNTTLYALTDYNGE